MLCCYVGCRYSGVRTARQPLTTKLNQCVYIAETKVQFCFFRGSLRLFFSVHNFTLRQCLTPPPTLLFTGPASVQTIRHPMRRTRCANKENIVTSAMLSTVRGRVFSGVFLYCLETVSRVVWVTTTLGAVLSKVRRYPLMPGQVYVACLRRSTF